MADPDVVLLNDQSLGSESQLQTVGGIVVPSEVLVSTDGVTTMGYGTALDPVVAVALPSVASAQIRLTATIDGDGNIAFSDEVINLSGGMTYGGLDQSLVDSLNALKVILTLPRAYPDANKLPQPGVHFPILPPTTFLSAVFLGIPPVPLQGVDDTDASMLVQLFGSGDPSTVEVIDVTYDLLLVSRS